MIEIGEFYRVERVDKQVMTEIDVGTVRKRERERPERETPER